MDEPLPTPPPGLSITLDAQTVTVALSRMRALERCCADLINAHEQYRALPDVVYANALRRRMDTFGQVMANLPRMH